MLTIHEARESARALAEAGYDSVVIHAPTWRDDSYTYQPAAVEPAAGEQVIERYPAAGTPAYLRATPEAVLRGWCEAYGARTAVERDLVAECHRRAQETGLSFGLILMDAERYWKTHGRAAEPRRWRSRAAACRRMLDHAASR